MADGKRSRDRDLGSRARQVGVLTAVPAVLVAGPLVGLLIGKFLDAHFGTGPWLLLVCLALGFAAAGVEVKRLLAVANEDDVGPSDSSGPTAGPRDAGARDADSPGSDPGTEP